MKSRQNVQSQPLSMEEQLAAVTAKTALPPGAKTTKPVPAGRLRMLGKGPLESYCYHVTSRTNGSEIWFDDAEKTALRQIIWRMVEFAGIKVVTYCVMGNHFHLLLEVPNREIWLQRFTGPNGEAKLFDHLKVLYDKTYLKMLREDLGNLRKQGKTTLAEQRIGAVTKRFCEMPLLVKEVKERFSRWYNKRHGRRGTLWMDRFKSVLVEGHGDALRTMAAYIDLNPIRAGLVKHPQDYAWCGYGEAHSGSRKAQRGLCKALGKPLDGWKKEGAAEYRRLLQAEGQEIGDASTEKTAHRAVTAKKARSVLAEKGRLSVADLVKLRVRYFTDGVVLGSKEFVEGVFEGQRDRFSPKRKTGAKRISQAEEPLYALRQLRVRAVE